MNPEEPIVTTISLPRRIFQQRSLPPSPYAHLYARVERAVLWRIACCLLERRSLHFEYLPHMLRERRLGASFEENLEDYCVDDATCIRPRP